MVKAVDQTCSEGRKTKSANFAIPKVTDNQLSNTIAVDCRSIAVVRSKGELKKRWTKCTKELWFSEPSPSKIATVTSEMREPHGVCCSRTKVT